LVRIELIPVEVRLRRFVINEVQFTVASVHDITDRKREQENSQHLQSLPEI
jgi:hypothetical protein